MASQDHIEFDYVVSMQTGVHYGTGAYLIISLQCSSIGAVNTSFLAALYYACQGTYFSGLARPKRFCWFLTSPQVTLGLRNTHPEPPAGGAKV